MRQTACCCWLLCSGARRRRPKCFAAQDLIPYRSALRFYESTLPSTLRPMPRINRPVDLCRSRSCAVVRYPWPPGNSSSFAGWQSRFLYLHGPVRLLRTDARCAAVRREPHSRAARSSCLLLALLPRTSGPKCRHGIPPECRPCSSCLPATLESGAGYPSAGSCAPSSGARR